MKPAYFLLALLFLLPVDGFVQNISVKRSLLVPKQASAFHINHSAAFNTRTGQTVVVWEKVSGNTHKILGRILNNQGNAASGIVTMAAGNDLSHPQIAYDPTRNDFLLAFDNNAAGMRTHTDIFIKRLNSQGRPSGQSIRVSTDEASSRMWNFQPRIIYNPHDSNYTILWIREFVTQTDQGSSGLVGTTLTSATALPGAVEIIQRSTAEFDWPVPLDAQIHPSINKLLVVFALVPTGVNGTRANYHLANMNANLTAVTPSNIKKINSAPLTLSSDFVWGSQMALFEGAPGFVVFVENKNIKRRRLDSSGKLSGPSLAAFRSPNSSAKMFYPGVAFSGTGASSRGVLVAAQNVFSENGSAKLWAQPIDSSGAASAAPVTIDMTSNTSTAISMTILPAAQTARTGFFFTSLYSLADFQPPGQTFRNSTIVRLTLNLLLPSAP